MKKSFSLRPVSKGLAATALAFGLAAGAMSLVPAPEAQAAPSYSVTTTFYSDATKTTAVGFRELTCSGGQIIFGSTSSFKTTIYEPCP